MDETSISLGPPRGMRDFYPEDAALRARVFDAWRAAARRHGFSEYDACVVESLDLLKRKAGEEIVEQIYAFKDKSGRDLALRPEMTPSLARMIAARQGSLQFPVKWSCIAQCFRYERTTRGRKREHYQWNLDIVGEDDVSAEAEVVATALDALRALGVGDGDVRVHFSSRALLADLLVGAGIPEAHHAATFLALDKRGKIGDDELRALLAEHGMDRRAAERVFGVLAVQSLDDALELLGRPTAAYDRVIAFADLLACYGHAASAVFDASVIRGLAYYTGIVFEGFDTAGELRAVFGGGRYDNLLSDVGGKPASGVGLGFGDVVVGELLAGRATDAGALAPAQTAVGYMGSEQRPDAIRLASMLRAGDTATDLALHPEKARQFFARTAKRGFREAVYIGPDDVAAGQVRVKDLASRTERTLALP